MARVKYAPSSGEVERAAQKKEAERTERTRRQHARAGRADRENANRQPQARRAGRRGPLQELPVQPNAPNAPPVPNDQPADEDNLEPPLGIPHPPPPPIPILRPRAEQLQRAHEAFRNPPEPAVAPRPVSPPPEPQPEAGPAPRPVYCRRCENLRYPMEWGPEGPGHGLCLPCRTLAEALDEPVEPSQRQQSRSPQPRRQRTRLEQELIGELGADVQANALRMRLGIGRKFVERMGRLNPSVCPVCQEAKAGNFPVGTYHGQAIPMCPRCSEEGKKGRKALIEAGKDPNTYVYHFSRENDAVPGNIPPALAAYGELTKLESMMLARVHPQVQIYQQSTTRNSRNRAGQQFFRGHCISVKQDVTQIINRIPQLPQDLPVVVVRKYGWQGVGHMDFDVNFDRLRAWAYYLKNNNKHYRDVEIDHDALETLKNFVRQDRNLMDLCHSGRVDEASPPPPSPPPPPTPEPPVEDADEEVPPLGLAVLSPPTSPRLSPSSPRMSNTRSPSPLAPGHWRVTVEDEDDEEGGDWFGHRLSTPLPPSPASQVTDISFNEDDDVSEMSGSEDEPSVQYRTVPDLQMSATEEELLADRLGQHLGIPADHLRNPAAAEAADFDIPDDPDEDEPRPSIPPPPPSHLTAPTLGSVLNEFNTEGFLAMAFPNLYPDGCADLRDQSDRHHELNPAEYFRHLLRFKDSRFALDVRFLFFAFNCKMRWALLDDARLFLTKNPRFKNITAAELREELKDPSRGPKLAKKISRFASSLPGLAPYWHRKRSDLLAVIDELGTPTLFFTLSAADTQWSDLHQLIENHRSLARNSPPWDLSLLPEAEAKKIRHENLVAFPHIAAQFLEERFRAALGEVFKQDPEMPAVDHWARFEWQFRGSGHIHGFLWVKGAPNVDDLDLEKAEDRAILEEYFDKIVWAHAPVGNVEIPAIHPVSKTGPSNIDDASLLLDLAELFLTVQGPHRHSGYCERRDKQTRQTLCRFNFPKPIREKTEIIKNEKGKWHIEFRRGPDDVNYNQYCPWLLQIWRANVDVTPVLSRAAVINYIAKYASKAETASLQLNELMLHSTRNADETNSALSLISKCLMAFPIQRDFSAQEASHIIFGLSMVDSSRAVTVANLYENAGGELLLEEENGPVTHGSIVDKYMARSNELNNRSLYTLLKNYRYISKTKTWSELRDTSKSHVLRVIPNPAVDPTNPAYCRITLLLHIPFRHPSLFFEDEVENGDNSDSEDRQAHAGTDPRWVQALQEHFLSLPEKVQRQINEVERQARGEGQVADFEGFEDEEDFEQAFPELNPHMSPGEQELWQQIQGMGQHSVFPIVNPGDGDAPAAPGLPEGRSWSDDLLGFDNLAEAATWISGERGESISEVDNSRAEVFPDQLNMAQRRIYNTVLAQHHASSQAPQSQKPLSALIRGTAGTGKSFLIAAIQDGIVRYNKENNIGRNAPKNHHVPLAAYTGVAAFNIKGETCTRLFGLPHALSNATPPPPLKPDRLRAFQNRFCYVKTFIIDEMSMLSSAILGVIDLRLQEIFPNQGPFGGRGLVLLGDFRQLPPVKATPIWQAPDPSKALSTRGYALYRSHFRHSYKLEKIERQGGDEPEQVAFRDLLSRARDATWVQADFSMLSHRTLFSLLPQECDSFKTALRLMPTKVAVANHNEAELHRMQHPVLSILAKHTGGHPESVLRKLSSEDAGNLAQELRLCVGARVMIRWNLWTDTGIANGALGDVIGFHFQNENDTVPQAILVRLDVYTGPPFNEADPRVVPIPIQRATFMHEGRECARTQFPIVLAWAITVHKSQGLTLDRVVIDLGSNDHSTGLTFVAISRVRRLTDLAFASSFAFDRLKKNANSTVLKARLIEDRRLDMLGNDTMELD